MWKACGTNSCSSRNELEKVFYETIQTKSCKWHHYLRIYHRHLGIFKNQTPHVLEIGVDEGGSLQMWRDYFGQGCKVYGIDIKKPPRELGDDIVVFVGDQSEKEFLSSVTKETGHLDVVIDDGSHLPADQISSFMLLFPALKDGGVYICEDTHACYMQNYQGNAKAAGTFIDYAKKLVDSMHHQYNGEIERTIFNGNIKCVCFYDSMVVIEKGTKDGSLSFWTTSGVSRKKIKFM